MENQRLALNEEAQSSGKKEVHVKPIVDGNTTKKYLFIWPFWGK